MKVDFQVVGIQENEIQELLRLSDTAYERLGIRKMVVNEKPGYPCRLSLADAEIGEEVLLLNYEHHKVGSPYRSSGPVFIRTAARQANLPKNELPIMLYHRLLSLRVYDTAAMMVDARTVPGRELEETIQDIFANPEAVYIQVHNSGPGCYNCQVNRMS